MSRSASYDRHQRNLRKAKESQAHDPNEYIIATDPGCDHPLHREEVYGAMVALFDSGPWSGRTQMDCGCVLWLERRP